MRRMRGSGGEIREEWSPGRDRLLLANPANALIREVARELVAVFRPLRRLDRIRVANQRWIKLIGLTGDEAVEIVEALIGRPVPARTGGARLIVRHVVVLAEPRAGVSSLLQQLGDRRAALRNDSAIARIPGRHFLNDAGCDRVMVASGQKRCARRRAQG